MTGIPRWALMHSQTEKAPACNPKTNSRGEKLLEFATYDNLILANTLGNQKNSCKRTCHAPNVIYHKQIGYIMIPQCFKSRIKEESTHTFSGADNGSNHDLVTMNFCACLKKTKRQQNPWNKFDLEWLNDPEVAQSFQAFTGGKQLQHKILLWVTDKILQHCDTRRQLKKERNGIDGSNKYKEDNRNIKKSMKEAKEKWIEDQCKDTKGCISNNNSKKVFQVVKDLTKKQKSAVYRTNNKSHN